MLSATGVIGYAGKMGAWGGASGFMGQVHLGLHDLQMWVRTWDGNVQHKVHGLYLESCSDASARWRSEFTRRQNAEAAAQVVARHTYDANDCRALTGTPSHMRSVSMSRGPRRPNPGEPGPS